MIPITLDPFYGLAASAIGGYFIGTMTFGLIIGWLFGLGDIRNQGSGNVGATNMLRTGRKDLALATLALDAGKGAVALLIARALFGEQAGLVAAAAAFVGHCFPVWLKFNGGKGVATFFGVLLAGALPVGLVAAAVWLMTAFVFRFSSLAALAAAALAPVAAYAFHAGLETILFCALLAAVIYWRHRKNIARLIRAEEPKIGQAKRPHADIDLDAEPA